MLFYQRLRKSMARRRFVDHVSSFAAWPASFASFDLLDWRDLARKEKCDKL